MTRQPRDRVHTRTSDKACVRQLGRCPYPGHLLRDNLQLRNVGRIAEAVGVVKPLFPAISIAGWAATPTLNGYDPSTSIWERLVAPDPPAMPAMSSVSLAPSPAQTTRASLPRSTHSSTQEA